MMRSSARLFQQAANLPKVVTKVRTATTTYRLNPETTMTIKHKPIQSYDDLLMTMIGQPLIGRLALAVAHQAVIPANAKAIRDLCEVVDLNGFHGAQYDKQMDFLSLLSAFNTIHHQRISAAYDYSPVRYRM